MVFELNDALISGIIFAMENQERDFVLDAERCTLVCAEEADRSADRYYELPSWDSAAGYDIMERFVSHLYNPPASQALRSVLSSGRGVFRSFKQELKKYPEAERLWTRYKRREMAAVVQHWYNGLREAWGLEKIGEEPEDTEDLIRDDFIFRKAQAQTDADFISRSRMDTDREYIEQSPGSALASGIARLLRPDPASDLACMLIAQSLSRETAGFAAAHPFPEGKTETALITDLFVLPAYRGLGVGGALLSSLMGILAEQGFTFLAAMPPVSDSFCHFLLQRGFVCADGICAVQLDQLNLSIADKREVL